MKTALTFGKGNFALWFNKLIPLNNENACKPCNLQGNINEAVALYKAKYDAILQNNPLLTQLLVQKQTEQENFCQNYKKIGFVPLTIRAQLKSPLITGIGQTHPNEVGMVFDHTLGIPYIPAASIKGVLRLAHLLGLIQRDDAVDYVDGASLDDAIAKTGIPDMFGGYLKKNKDDGNEKMRKGKIIFLDAYPDAPPRLHVDIMNPHYGDYYNDDQGATPPADYLEPTPIKFLTVQPGTTFIFRAVSPDRAELKRQVIEAYQNALQQEGVGAKTAVGYGRFEILAIEGKPGASSQTVDSTVKNEGDEKTQLHSEQKTEIWENAYLSWTRNNQTLTASTSGNKRAENTAVKNIKELVPQEYLDKFASQKKKKALRVNKVIVELVGNAYHIVQVY